MAEHPRVAASAARGSTPSLSPRAALAPIVGGGHENRVSFQRYRGSRAWPRARGARRGRVPGRGRSLLPTGPREALAARAALRRRADVSLDEPARSALRGVPLPGHLERGQGKRARWRAQRALVRVRAHHRRESTNLGGDRECRERKSKMAVRGAEPTARARLRKPCLPAFCRRSRRPPAPTTHLRRGPR